MMKHLLLIFLLVTTAHIMACAPTTQFPDVNKDLAEREAAIQRDIALKETHKYFVRLQDLSAPIFTANADICPKDKIKPFYGFHVNSTEVFDEKFREATGRVHGLMKQATVFHISPNTPAHGKLQEQDIIKKVDDEKINSGKRGLKTLYEYLDEEERLDTETAFIIERAGVPYTVKIRPVPACGGRAFLSDEGIVNAFADGENIIFTRQMMNLASVDDELALIIGHEVAHNSRKHIESKQGSAIIGMVLGGAVSIATGVNVMGMGSDLGGMAFSQDFEAEADYVGLYHAARAGYDIEGAPYVWRRMAASDLAGIDAVGGSHPADSYRFVALEEAVKEIKDKQAKGLLLIPEERDAPVVGKDQDEFNQ